MCKIPGGNIIRYLIACLVAGISNHPCISHFDSLNSMRNYTTVGDKFTLVAIKTKGKGCFRFMARLDQNSGFHGNK